MEKCSKLQNIYKMMKSARKSKTKRNKPTEKSLKSENGNPVQFKFFSTELPDQDAEVNSCKRRQKTQSGTIFLPKENSPQEDLLAPSCRTITADMTTISNDLLLTSDRENRGTHFGQLYEDNLLVHIHKYLEVDTYHKMLYIGEPRINSFVPILEKYFCLLSPITTIQTSGGNKPEESESRELVLSCQQTKMEEFLNTTRTEANKNKKFDRILIHDCARKLQNLEETFESMMKILHKFGKVLFIHRPGPLNTLPVCRKAKLENAENDLPFISIIKALEATGADVQWDLVHIPFRMPKSRWFSMLQNQFPEQPHLFSPSEIYEGMQELASGPFRYFEDEEMEAEDRIMMITASHRSFDCSFPSVQRCRGASQVPYHEQGDINFYLPLDEEIEEEMKKK